MVKCIFTLGSPAIGGGTNVIFEHATRMVDEGVDVYIVTEKEVYPEEYAWHNAAYKLKWVTYDDLSDIEFDVAIATWWRTVYELYKIKAKHYVYFVQSIESKFYTDAEKSIKLLAEMTYLLNLKVITEATWIKEYLENNYFLDVQLVLNGIRKDIFTLDGDIYEKNDGLRVLIEGPIDVSFKNVKKTIELVSKSNADEVWLLTSSDLNKYSNVDKVFSRIPVKDCAKIYRSCDVIVKLSYVEGMFGPPLEMFHCGGTCIVYDVTGHDEYIKHNKNGYVVKTDNEEDVIKYINNLKDNKNTLSKLKKNAIVTASKWPSWAESSKNFYIAVKNILKTDSISQAELEKKSCFYLSLYNEFENVTFSFRRYVGNYLRKNHSRIYKIYRKILGR